MTSQPIEENLIRIDRKTYRLNGRVQNFLASRQPGKVTIGDFSDSSNPLASEFSLGDFRDGIGVERGDIPDDVRRVWWSTGQLRYKDTFILPRRAVLTAAGTATNIDTLTIFQDEVFATYGTAVHVYDSSTDSWGSSVRMLAASATDSAVGLLNGTETLVIANGTDVDYATNSSTWAENTGQAIKYVVFWADLLWGITNTGQMYYTDDLTETWTADAQLQLPPGSVTKLLVARGPDRNEHIYAVTNQGILVHDEENARFVPTDLQLPVHPDGGKGAEVWRGRIFTSAGNAVYSFQAGSDQTVVQTVGPDLDHGMPSDKRGVITSLIGSHNDLLALLDASTAQSVSSLSTRASRGVRFHHGVTFGSQTGFSSILGWNERGWEFKWLSGESARGITAGVVGNAYNSYRLWWAANQRVYYMQLPVDVVNPLQVTDSEFGDEAVLESPWFDMNMHNHQKLALSAIVETLNPTTDETVKIEYATDYVESFTTIATKDEGGEKKYRLPNDVNKQGVSFRAWKWKITLARGTTTTNTPQLIKLTLTWRPRITTLYGIRASLDLTKPVAGVPPVTQFKNLRTSLNKKKLIEVAYRADSSGEQVYLMDTLDLQTSEESGQTDYGSVTVTFAEPEATDTDRAVE